MSKVLKIVVYIVVISLLIYLLAMLFIKVKENLLPYDPKVDVLKKKLALVHPKATKISFYKKIIHN